MARKTFVLCECCALKLANDDDSSCRDYHGHDHASLDVPAGTAITQGPHDWDGTLALACHGHKGGTIETLGQFWVAELVG